MNTIAIAATEAKEAAAYQDGLAEQLKAAMIAMRSHWLITDEDERFRAAVAGVMLLHEQDSDEYERLRTEMKTLNMLSAAISGVPVNFATIADEEDRPEPVGLMQLWQETATPS